MSNEILNGFAVEPVIDRDLGELALPRTLPFLSTGDRARNARSCKFCQMQLQSANCIWHLPTANIEEQV